MDRGEREREGEREVGRTDHQSCMYKRRDANNRAQITRNARVAINHPRLQSRDGSLHRGSFVPRGQSRRFLPSSAPPLSLLAGV